MGLGVFDELGFMGIWWIRVSRYLTNYGLWVLDLLVFSEFVRNIGYLLSIVLTIVLFLTFGVSTMLISKQYNCSSLCFYCKLRLCVLIIEVEKCLGLGFII